MTKKEQHGQKLLIGAHTSIAGNLANALLEGVEIGATTIQMFSANQKRWEGKPLTPEVLESWHETLKSTGLEKIMVHDSYLINLGAPDGENLRKSRVAFKQEVERCIKLDVSYLNFHPGAALTDKPENCLDRICESIQEVEDLVNNSSLRLLLESTAGQGSAVGYSFEQLAYLLHKLEKKVRIGICVDTCHAFVAGYDLRTKEAFDATLNEFERIIGFKHLYAFHLNDSVKDLGSRVDRHASLGKGLIGLECFKLLMQDPRTRFLPKYLETPEGLPVWKEEITMLRKFAGENKEK